MTSQVNSFVELKLPILFLEHFHRQIPIALDIGSGSGNVTELLLTAVNIKRLYGVDIDSDMCDYARDNYSHEGKIEYVQADFGLDIKHNTQLTALKGKVLKYSFT